MLKTSTRNEFARQMNRRFVNAHQRREEAQLAAEMQAVMTERRIVIRDWFLHMAEFYEIRADEAGVFYGRAVKTYRPGVTALENSPFYFQFVRQHFTAKARECTEWAKAAMTASDHRINLWLERRDSQIKAGLTHAALTAEGL